MLNNIQCVITLHLFMFIIWPSELSSFDFMDEIEMRQKAFVVTNNEDFNIFFWGKGIFNNNKKNSHWSQSNFNFSHGNVFRQNHTNRVIHRFTTKGYFVVVHLDIQWILVKYVMGLAWFYSKIVHPAGKYIFCLM